MCTTGNARIMDPYEQQLLKVFDSYDFENCGSLDREGLTQLCCTLQLEEQGTELIQHLLSDPKNPRVTFMEFKEALLALLGKVQNSRTQANCDSLKDDKGSPDREVSPKFVYGSKKYGRRSRPKNDEIVLEDYTNRIAYNNNNTTVQRSNSQSEVLHSKKRKTNTKLKRCTSFPGSHNYDSQKPSSGDVFVTNGFNNDHEFVCTEEMLRKAWETLGVGEDGYLNRTELILVCDAIGLHKLADGVIRQLSNKLELDVDHKISFQELLEALQQDDTWSDLLNPTSPTNTSDTSIDLSSSNVNCISDSVFPDPKAVQHIQLGPDGTGFVHVDVVMEMWENIGISSPKVLLQELGFVNLQISVPELAAKLEKEIKTMGETKSTFTNPHIILLQAVLALYKSEIKCLKNILEQMHAEREKLKGDVLEANNRATMLAQEVDDNHARMEQNTHNQVKLLEQRHADMVKEMQQQFVGEKESLSHANQNLEHKIMCLESDEAKLRNELQLTQEYSSTVEKENHILSGQISELRQFKEVLTEQVNMLESEKQSYEFENQQAQIEPLLKKLSDLQIENSHLRDKNDEMITEIESLNSQVCAMRTKVSSTPNVSGAEQNMEDNFSIVYEGVGLGFKRRNDDSPSKDLNILGLGDVSPRLGKVRKCHRDKTESLELPVASSESGFDTELEPLDSSLSLSINENEEIARLQARIVHLEDVLRTHSILLPANSFNLSSESVTTEMKIKQLTQRCVDLQNVIVAVQTDLNKMLLQTDQSCGCENSKFATNLNNRLMNIMYEKTSIASKERVDVGVETEIDLNTSLEERIAKYIDENKDLAAKCAELENCIELLRTEYERCEDYWASKLDDERQMFEQEQNQSSEKLTELIGKMAEYEAQFNGHDEPDYRLPPIEEKYSLEKQFTDLEQEFEEYKEHAEFQLTEKVNEIADLKEKLCELEQKATKEVGVQVDETASEFEQHNLEIKMSNLTNCVIESTNLFSADTMPCQWSRSQDMKEQSSENIHAEQRDFVSPVLAWNRNNSKVTNSSQMNIPWQSSKSSLQPFSIITSADSVSTVTDNNSTPSRPKRSRKHDKNYKLQRLNKREDSKKDGDTPSSIHSNLRWHPMDNLRVNNGEQMVSIPISVLHNLNGRLHHLEQRCRHLQVVLKQQHYHAEQMLQHCWQQHRGEKAELQYMLQNSQDKLENQMRVCNEQLERLARTDVLVKDLYVENSYLMANVQRLEKQCHMLTQYNSASSSV